MAILGYFDGSGGPERPVISVAGFIATEVGWKNFESDWEEALAFGGVPYLHMKQFAHFKSPFDHFKGKTEHRNEFMSRAVTAIERHMNVGISVTVSYPVYDAVNADYELEETIGNAYSVCGHWALHIAGEEYSNQFLGKGLSLFVESGDEGQGKMIDALKAREFRWPPTLVAKKREDGTHIRPLEAADLLAYESHNLGTRLADLVDPKTNRSKGKVRYLPGGGLETTLERKPMERLLALNPRIVVATGIEMLFFCEKFNVPRRKPLGTS